MKPSATRTRLSVVPLLVLALCALALPGRATAAETETVAAAPAQAAATTYTNPVVTGLSANPSVMKSGSTYYAYVSGFDYYVPFPVLALSSTDLVTWTQVGNVLPTAQAGSWADVSSGWKFRSPSVRHIPGNPAASRYVMYFSGTHKTTGATCIGAATAAGPAGPFTGAAEPLICPQGGATDPSAVPLPADAPIQELVYVKKGTDAGIYNQVLSADGLSLSGAPFLLYKANPGWWHQGVVERPAITLTADGRIYLLFAGGPAGTKGRAIGWTTCTQGFGVVNDCRRQTRFGGWIGGTAQADSPSGPQVFSDGTHQWLAYDGLPGGSCPATGACTGTRSMRIDKLCFTDRGIGEPRTNAPSTTAQSLTRQSGCSQDLPGRPFGIVPGSVADDTVVGQAPKIAFRDGGSTSPIAGRTVWNFSDSLNTGGCPSRSNTAALGAPAAGATGPAWTTEMVDANGCPPQFIPYNAAETAYNQNPACPPDQPGCNWRMALWEVGMVPLPDGDVAVFFLKLIDKRCWACYEFLGIGVTRMKAADVSSGNTVVTRNTPGACNPDCLFQGADKHYFRPFADRGYVYMYATATLTRAPLAELQDRSKWRFWTGSAWSAQQSDAVDVPGLFEGGWDKGAGQIVYNPHLDRYLNIVADNWPETYKFVAQTSPEPWGPWTAEQPVHDATPHKCADGGDPYGALQAPEFWENNGRGLNLTYARPGPNLGTSPTCPGQVRYVTAQLQP
ncbi:family 43 glycosylhydrolase [Spirillospora sp. NPDC047279]|uniref:family 43 glycosylhydrolase n=1 Tax=Spirillospora sp. NPDC047279 TaxID=3155478 RepID=UPI00340ADA85